jgi:hypothetical protein
MKSLLIIFTLILTACGGGGGGGGGGESTTTTDDGGTTTPITDPIEDGVYELLANTGTCSTCNGIVRGKLTITGNSYEYKVTGFEYNSLGVSTDTLYYKNSGTFSEDENTGFIDLNVDATGSSQCVRFLTRAYTYRYNSTTGVLNLNPSTIKSTQFTKQTSQTDIDELNTYISNVENLSVPAKENCFPNIGSIY